MAIMFPASRVTEFYKLHGQGNFPHQRLGQAFYNFMELHKVKNELDKILCDIIYEVKDVRTAMDIIEDHTDWRH